MGWSFSGVKAMSKVLGGLLFYSDSFLLWINYVEVEIC